jgi:Subtilase family
MYNKLWYNRFNFAEDLIQMKIQKMVFVLLFLLLSVTQTDLAQAMTPAQTSRSLAHRTSEIFISLTPETFNNCCTVNNHRAATAPAIVGATATHWLISEVGPNAQKAGFDRVVVADFNRSFMFPGLTGTKSEAKATLATARRYFARVAEAVEAKIDGIEPSQVQTAAASSPSVPQQWYLGASGIQPLLNAVQGGQSPTTVIMDAGINPPANIDYVYSKSYVGGSAFEDPSTTAYPNGHGTLVYNVIETVNRTISGPDWHGRIVSYRIFHPVVLDQAGHTTLTTSSEIILKASVALLDIPGDRLLVNCSFGYPADADDLNMGLWKTAIQELGDRALIVAAAGNNGDNAPQYPAAFGLPNVITVASTGDDSRLSPFSTFGTLVDLAAPGSNIVSMDNSGKYVSVDGTSMSSPIVNGSARPLWDAKPWLTSAQLRQMLLDGATFNPLLIGKLAPRQFNYAGSLAALERGKLITPIPAISVSGISPDPAHVAWGQTVTVRGNNFTDGYTAVASGSKPVTWLNGIIVLINQYPVPLLSVGPEEILFLVPNDTWRALPGNDNLSIVRFGDLTWTMSTLSWTTTSIHVGQ